MRFLAVIAALLLLVTQMPAAEPQWRAFWVDAFNPGIKTPAQVDRLVADLKALHCNAVITQVRKRGDAYFRKTVDPFADDRAVPAGFDPLGDLLQKAHKEGIQVHAWVNPLTLWRANDAPPSSPRHLFHLHGPKTAGRDNWLTCDENGNFRSSVGYYLDPGHPDVVEHLVRVVTDLVKQYPVDGVHLDYIRYPETEGDFGVGYNAVNVERFNRAHGREGKPDRNDAVWKAWRRQQVTQLVRRLRVAVLEERPNVLFSAALIPWGDGPADEASFMKSAPYVRVFQDWHAWRKEGLLDLTVPMNYDRQAREDQRAFFAHWVNFEKAYRYRSKLIVGVGAYLNSVPDTLAQLRLALADEPGRAPADGACFYNYAAFRHPAAGKPTLEELRQALVAGPGAPFAEPTALPTVDRLTKPAAGTLWGIARDDAGQPLDSRPVKLEREGGETVTVTADGNGFYAALFLKPGRYRVSTGATADVVAGKMTLVK